MKTRIMIGTIGLATLLTGASVLIARQDRPQAAPPEKQAARIMLSAEQWSEQDLHDVAVFVNASQYVFLPADLGPVFFEAGNPLLQLGAEYGQVLEVGNTVTSGVYWNFSRDPARLQVQGAGNFIDLQPRSIVIIGQSLRQPGLDAAQAGAITGTHGELRVIVARSATIRCKDGYYACCTGTGSAMSAKCIKENGAHAPVCDAGGPGSVECTISDN